MSAKRKCDRDRDCQPRPQPRLNSHRRGPLSPCQIGPSLEPKRPTLLRLALGEVQEAVAVECENILGHLEFDEVLSQNASTMATVLERLYVTTGHVIGRFNRFSQYPSALALLSGKYNPEGHAQAALRFLSLGQDELDAGLSLPLQQEAWTCSGPRTTEAQAYAYLLSVPVQAMLDTFCYSIQASSLDVERSHNVVKQSEQRKLVSVGTASRNAILAKWRSQSGGHLHKKGAVERRRRKKLLKARKVNIVNLALKRRPDLFPCMPCGARLRRGSMITSEFEIISNNFKFNDFRILSPFQ